MTQQQLADTCAALRAKLAATGVSASWCAAEAAAVWELWEACELAMTAPQVRYLLGPPASERRLPAGWVIRGVKQL